MSGTRDAAPLTRCGRCDQENPLAFRFCGACGAPLAEPGPADAREVRKVVTIVFSDVSGSTQLGERLDPESMRRVMSRYFEQMRSVVERHGGTVEKFIGDALMAVFGVPTIHEDDAVRAVRAAAEMRDALDGLNDTLETERGVRISIRTGIQTGEVVAGDDGDTLATGDAVNTAARLEQTAEPGEILLGAATYRLVRDAVIADSLPPLTVRGKTEPVEVFRLHGVIPGAPGHVRRLDSPLVGRVREQRLLREAFLDAVESSTCHLFTLLGTAGVGKSRLVQESLAGLRDAATVLRGRCLPYGEGITFWPLAEAIREVAAIGSDEPAASARRKVQAMLGDDRDAAAVMERVSAAIGLGTPTPATPEDTAWAVRRLFERLARDRPLVVVFDDIHWAEPTFLDLVDHLADWSRSAPILLLCMARPDLLEARPAWGGGKLHATSVLLEPLSAEDLSILVRNLLGGGEVARDVETRVIEASEGNPLFVEEFIAMLVDDGVLRREGGSWIADDDLSRVTVPPTVSSLLAARLDRLGRQEREVIERAAVVGKVFWRDAVTELAPAGLRPVVAACLLALTRKELVRPDESSFAGDEGYRFRHMLVRDSAYAALPKEERVTLHERFAMWLERKAGTRLAEYEEVIAYHLEQAFRYRRELAPLDDDARALGLRAADRLGAAARRALLRGDVPAARNLLERAAALREPADPERQTLELALVEVIAEAGDLDAADELLRDLARRAGALPDPVLRWRARVAGWMLALYRAPQGLPDRVRAGLPEARRIFEAAHDDQALAEMWTAQASITYIEGRLTASREASERALRHAERAGDLRLASLITTSSGGLVLFDETPVERGIEVVRDALATARERGARFEEALSLSRLGRLEAMRSDFEAGRELVDKGTEMMRELGRRLWVAGSTHWDAELAHLAGDVAAEERAHRRGYEELAAMGERSYLSTSAARLAVLLAARGAVDEAEHFAAIGEDAAADEDFASQVAARSARALVLATRGSLEAADALASEAVALADATEFFDLRIDSRLGLAWIRAQAGDDAAARQLYREVRERAARKGVTAIVERMDGALTQPDAHP